MTMSMKYVFVCVLTNCFIVCFCQWDEAPQWERASRVARQSDRGGSFYTNSICPDYPGNKPPPEHCPPDHRWGPCGCYIPPFWPFDPIEVEVKNTKNEPVGRIIGRSLEYRNTPARYVNFFLGVPYAKRPIYERRFQV